jgi:8-oxoguanine deaminase
MRLWIKNPLAGMPPGAEGGLVIEDAIIAELVPPGGQPVVDAVFDASAHVVLPGLINTHHHFYQTLTRAFAPAVDKKLFDWLVALYPAWPAA